MIAEYMAENKEFRVVNPIYDVPEKKLSGEGLGHIAMTPAVKYSLIALRVYLFLMFGLLSYDLAGMTGLVK